MGLLDSICCRRRNSHYIKVIFLSCVLLTICYVGVNIYSDLSHQAGLLRTNAAQPLQLFSLHSADKTIKRIYKLSDVELNVKDWDFSECQYSNCKIYSGVKNLVPRNADVLIFNCKNLESTPIFEWKVRERQLWIIHCIESQAYAYNRWHKSANWKFNTSMTYHRDSDIPLPFGLTVKKTKETPNLNYAATKTKTAFTYISNCGSAGYSRLSLIKSLQQHIDIDVYGKCTDDIPCNLTDSFQCEAALHKQYHFYLSFENSLCDDYVTEKFWNRLASPAAFVPVAIGGYSEDDYSRLSPPDSFLHLYNFISLTDLASRMEYLMKNVTAYNSYHAWRSKYDVKTTDEERIKCKLCEVANNKKIYHSNKPFADWWNDRKKCRGFTVIE